MLSAVIALYVHSANLQAYTSWKGNDRRKDFLDFSRKTLTK